LISYDSSASSAWTGGTIIAGAESIVRWGDALLREHVLSANGRKQQLTFAPVEAGNHRSLSRRTNIVVATPIPRPRHVHQIWIEESA
jgi:hypothetical protein